MAVQYFEGIGRRKESTARVRLMNGSGRFIVNDKEALNLLPPRRRYGMRLSARSRLPARSWRPMTSPSS